jgi:hypothetical protein
MRNEVGKSLWSVALFTLAYLIVALGMGIVRGNVEFLIYIAVVAIMAVVIWIVDKRVDLARGTLWGLSIWGLAHMSGGLVEVPASWPTNEGGRVLYTLWLIPDLLKFDQLVHAFGFGITTWLCWQAMRSVSTSNGEMYPPTSGRLILAASAGMGFGALNEVIEFSATLILPSTGVGGYTNTGWDLVANLVGATIAVTLIYLFEAPRRVPRRR